MAVFMAVFMASMAAMGSTEDYTAASMAAMGSTAASMAAMGSTAVFMAAMASTAVFMAAMASTAVFTAAMASTAVFTAAFMASMADTGNNQLLKNFKHSQNDQSYLTKQKGLDACITSGSFCISAKKIEKFSFWVFTRYLIDKKFCLKYDEKMKQFDHPRFK